MNSSNAANWRFPLSIPEKRWKRIVIVFLGKINLVLNPNLRKRLSSGNHPKSKIERWSLASIVNGLEKANNTEELKQIHRKLWENADAFHFHMKAKGRLKKVLDQFHDRFDEFIRNQVDKGITNRIVEIGCGSALILEYFEGKHQEFKSFIGLDINKVQITENQLHFANKPKMSFFSCDANQWIKENHENGTIYFTVGGVLEYFTEKEIRDIFKLVKTTESALMIFEPIKGDVDPFEVGVSQTYGNELSFSHSYSYLAKSSGLNIVLSERHTIRVSWLLMFASSK
jgi:hypothetical protein